MNHVVEARGITKWYGEGDQRQLILDGVSLGIAEAEFVAVMGPSGSGKSTLMYTLSGMEHLDGGSARVGGIDLSTLGERQLADLRREKMGFVFQQPTLLKNLTILDNIILPAVRDRRRSLTEVVEKARRLMKLTGIDGLEERGITEASGGQLQRVGICRGLINEPRIIFADEPTGPLHTAASQQIMELVARIHAEGTAVMLVTHDATVASRCERVIVIEDGSIVGQLRLGTYDPNAGDLSEREERLVRWMAETQAPPGVEAQTNAETATTLRLPAESMT